MSEDEPKGFQFGPWHDSYLCEEHSYLGDLPCPWPDCRYGHSASELVGRFPGSETRKRFERRRYSGLDDEDRFLWLGDAGAVLGADRRASLQINRIAGARKDQSPSLIYHYTDPNGLLGIVESQEFWLTDYRYLNDYREVVHGHALASDILAEFAGQDLDLLGDKTLRVLESELEDLDRLRIAVCCFSEDPDSLPQWRAYGDLALGISLEPIALGHAPDAVLDRVLYDEEAQRRALRITINEYLESLSIDQDSELNATPENVGRMMAAGVVRRLGFFKNPAYREEREVRYCLVEDPLVHENLGLGLAPKRYRSVGGLIIPFVGSKEITLDVVNPREEHRLPIAEVVVGPTVHADLLAQGVRELLDSHGYESAKVRHSTVPYRSL